MWFKNLRFYRLAGNLDFSPEHLETRLAEQAFTPCANMEFSRFGWVPPLGRHSEMLTHGCNGQIMICARRQEKILPAAAVNELVEQKVVELESAQARSVYRKERRNIRENVIHTLLPRALTRSAHTWAWIAPRQGLLLVDVASATKAEEFLDYLRITMGSVPATPLSPHHDAVEVMTRWLKQGAPDGFDLDGECELRNPRESHNVIRCRNQELESEEVAGHLKAGKRVVKLALNWKEAIRFVLNEDFSLKRIRFEDAIIEEAQTEAEDAASQFDQDFAVMSLQLGHLVDELLTAFGGPASRQAG